MSLLPICSELRRNSFIEGKNCLEEANSFFEEKMVPLVMMEEVNSFVGETEPMEVMPVALIEGMKALEEEQMLWKPGVKVEGLSFCSLKKNNPFAGRPCQRGIEAALLDRYVVNVLVYRVQLLKI